VSACAYVHDRVIVVVCSNGSLILVDTLTNSTPLFELFVQSPMSDANASASVPSAMSDSSTTAFNVQLLLAQRDLDAGVPVVMSGCTCDRRSMCAHCDTRDVDMIQQVARLLDRSPALIQLLLASVISGALWRTMRWKR
jgi:hypothetical protein